MSIIKTEDNTQASIIENINALPPIRQVVEANDLWATKTLGQNFIFDDNITAKIARSGNVEKQDIVLEIGSGPGGLTRQLLLKQPKRVIAIELDERAVPALEELKIASNNKLEVQNIDALKLKLADINKNIASDKINIISNLPYNIGTKLLVNWLDEIQHIKQITIMLQKEVAERICAKPSTKAYGRLSVLCQHFCHCNLLFDVPKECFIPQPKVTSSVISLQPKQNIDTAVDIAKLKELLQLAFNQRRKMLKVSLRKHYDNIEDILNKIGIAPTTRPEELSTNEFVCIAKELTAAK